MSTCFYQCTTATTMAACTYILLLCLTCLCLYLCLCRMGITLTLTLTLILTLTLFAFSLFFFWLFWCFFLLNNFQACQKQKGPTRPKGAMTHYTLLWDTNVSQNGSYHAFKKSAFPHPPPPSPLSRQYTSNRRGAKSEGTDGWHIPLQTAPSLHAHFSVGLSVCLSDCLSVSLQPSQSFQLACGEPSSHPKSSCTSRSSLWSTCPCLVEYSTCTYT